MRMKENNNHKNKSNIQCRGPGEEREIERVREEGKEGTRESESDRESLGLYFGERGSMW